MSRRSARLTVLLSRDTLIGAAVVVLAMAICVGLGLWQFGRFEDRRDRAESIEANYHSEPVALDDVLATPQTSLANEDDWTPVQMHGSYCADADCVLYVRNRTQSGSVGFWQLVPFRADEGTTLLVVRGWVESHPEESRPADPPAVPEGELTITTRLRPAEPVLERRENPAGQAHSVNPSQVAQQLPSNDTELVTEVYGELAAEEPETPRPEALPAPDTSLGPHLSYAAQWWIFALFFPGALFFRTRKVMQEVVEDEENGAALGAARPRAPARTRRRSQDEEEEDALIDTPHS